MRSSRAVRRPRLPLALFFPRSFVFAYFFFYKSAHIIHYFELRSMFFYCRWKKTFYQGIFSQNVRNMNFYRVTNIVPLVKTLESTSFVEFAFYCFLFSLRLWEMCKVLFCKVIVSKAPSTYYTIQKSEILTPPPRTYFFFNISLTRPSPPPHRHYYVIILRSKISSMKFCY